MKGNSVILTFVLLAAATLLSGCGNSTQVYGTAISNYEATDIKEILTKPTDYEDETVTIAGRIVRECPTGCWLDVGTDKAALYVDLNPAGFAIPQEVGSEVVVEGTIHYEDNQVSMSGQGVEIQ